MRFYLFSYVMKRCIQYFSSSLNRLFIGSISISLVKRSNFLVVSGLRSLSSCLTRLLQTLRPMIFLFHVSDIFASEVSKFVNWIVWSSLSGILVGRDSLEAYFRSYKHFEIIPTSFLHSIFRFKRLVSFQLFALRTLSQ